MKIRILNGAHAAMAYPAALLDIHFVHDAMADPQVRGFLDRLGRDEILPVVPPVPGTRLDEYQALVMRRFANPQVGDTIPRLCADGSNRQPKFILPSVADRLRQGAPVDGLALVGALWCRYGAGTPDSGAPVPGDDPNWERLQAHARRARDEPRAFLALTDIFGEIGTHETYAAAFAAALASLWRSGTRATLARYVDRPA
jgi:mannitol 2-dehydrogenase